MDVFDLVAKLTLDSSAYDKGLTGAEEEAKGFGSKLVSGLGNVAKVGGVAMAAVGTAAVATTTAIIKSTSEVAEYGDNIDKMSQKMGISAEAYQEWDAVMQHSGTSMESLKASMKTMASAAEKGNEAFQALGISEEEVASLSQEDLFNRVISGLQNMEEGTERTYLASQLLGRGATELGALLNTSAEDTQAMKDRVHELGGVMSDEAVKAAAAYQDTLQDLQTGFDGLKRNLLSDFMPGIVSVMDGLTDLTTGDYDLGVEKIGEGVDQFIEQITTKIPVVMEIGMKLLTALTTTLIQNAPKIVIAAAKIINMLVSGLASAIPELIPAVIQGVFMVATTILSELPTILNSVLDAVLGIVDFILNEGIPMIIAILPDLIVGIVEFILNAIPTILNAVLDITEALMDKTPEIMEMIAGMIPEIIMGVITALLKAGPQLIQVLFRLIDMTVASLPQIIVMIVKMIPEIVKAVVASIKDNWPTLKQAAMDAFKALSEGVVDSSVVGDFLIKVGEFIQKGLDKLKELIGKFKQIGIDIMMGLISGIKNKISEVTNVISGVASTVSSAFKKVLGIASPSKVFEGFGGFIDDGLAMGIDRGIGVVDDAMDSLYDSVVKVPDVNGNVGMGLYGEEESGYNGIVESFISALRQIGPLAIVQVEGNEDRIVDITVQANREYQRMTGNGLYA